MNSRFRLPDKPDPASPTTTVVPDSVVSHAKRVLEAARARAGGASAGNAAPVVALPNNVAEHAQRVLAAARSGTPLVMPIVKVEAKGPRIAPRPPAHPAAKLDWAPLLREPPPPPKPAPDPWIHPSPTASGDTVIDMSGQPPVDVDANLRRIRRALIIGIDGVLHPLSAVASATSAMTPTQIRMHSPDMFMHVDRLVRMLKGHSDVGVVISSSWCAFLNDRQLGEMLRPLSRWYCGSVGQLYRGRDVAIRAWTAAHPNVDSILVVDDAKNFFPGAVPELVACSSQQGLGDQQVRIRVRHWLKHGAMLA
ncbi:hypothetical protein BH10PSE17_BH10PSE17_26110 [soil metagenome]